MLRKVSKRIKRLIGVVLVITTISLLFSALFGTHWLTHRIEIWEDKNFTTTDHKYIKKQYTHLCPSDLHMFNAFNKEVEHCYIITEQTANIYPIDTLQILETYNTTINTYKIETTLAYIKKTVKEEKLLC